MTTFTFADFESILASHIAPDDWQKIRHLPITGICSDSRAVKNGEIFTLLSVNPDIKDKAKAFITPLSSTAVLSEFSKAEMDIDDAPMPIVYIPNLRILSLHFCKNNKRFLYLRLLQLQVQMVKPPSVS